MSRIAGRWEGTMSAGVAGAPVPATLLISPEGWYELVYGPAHGERRSRGRLDVRDGRVTYRGADGRSGAMVLHHVERVPVLYLTRDRPRGVLAEFRPAPSR